MSGPVPSAPQLVLGPEGASSAVVQSAQAPFPWGMALIVLALLGLGAVVMHLWRRGWRPALPQLSWSSPDEVVLRDRAFARLARRLRLGSAEVSLVRRLAQAESTHPVALLLSPSALAEAALALKPEGGTSEQYGGSLVALARLQDKLGAGDSSTQEQRRAAGPDQLDRCA